MPDEIEAGNRGASLIFHRRMTEGAGTSYLLKLDNTYSILTSKNVHVEVVSVELDDVYNEYESQYPEVNRRSNPIYEPYDVQVPVVKSRVVPSVVR